MVRKFDVLGIGSYSVDYLCTVSRYLVEDEKLLAQEVEVQGDRGDDRNTPDRMS